MRNVVLLYSLKSIILFFLISFSSCNLNSEADLSPQITFYNITVNSQAVENQNNIVVEDTLRMNILLQGYYHQLTELVIASEDDYVEMVFDNGFDETGLFSSNLNTSYGKKYIFKTGIKTATIPLKVIAIKKKQLPVELKFSLESKSSARGDYNPRRLIFSFGIADKSEE